jgi:deoxyribonuclease-4
LKAPEYFLGSAKEALSYKANAMMVYTGAPQNSARKPMEMLKLEEGRALLESHGWSMHQVIVHAPYIINLANTVKPETAEFGAEFLAQELQRVSTLGADILVLHPGSHLKQGADIGISSIVEKLDEILDADSSNVTIALEAMAGKGSEIGRTFEEIQAIIEKSRHPERLGVCLDTCHLNDAGYDLTDFDGILDEFDKVVGLEKLKVLHVNDSKNERGAHKDRHENIGKGTIGFEILAGVVHNPRLDNLIKVLETPYIDDKPPYAEEIEMLRNWKKEK